jgi:hypothetical protein
MTPLIKESTGTNPLASVFNAIRRNLRERTPLNGRDIEWDYTPDGFRPRFKGRIESVEKGGVKIRLVLVSEVFPDYLVCRSLDSTIGTDEILVAKPHELRQSTWAGQTLRGILYGTLSDIADGQARDGNGRTEYVTPGYIAKFPFVPLTPPPESHTQDDIRGAVISIVELDTIVITTTHRGSGTGITRLDINDAGRQFLADSGSNAKQFQIESVAGRYLECRAYDAVSDTISGERVIVARPPTLRMAEGGNTQTRTTDAITERINPLYLAGQTIYAAYVAERVSVGGGLTCNWIDINADARRWELIMTNIPVCQNGVTRYLQARANGPGDFNSQTGGR